MAYGQRQSRAAAGHTKAIAATQQVKQDQAKAFEAADRFETKPRDKSGSAGVINPYVQLVGPDRE